MVCVEFTPSEWLHAWKRWRISKMHCLCIMIDEIETHSYKLKQIDNIWLCLGRRGIIRISY